VYTPWKHFMMVENSSGQFNYTYVYLDSTLVARKDHLGNVLYYHSDHLGSTNLVTDSNGEVVEETFYTPFGQVEKSPEVEKKVGYTGHELDSTGQVYMKARFYDPERGQFVQPDSMLPNVYDPQQLNRYSYVRNNPFKYVDPDGHSSAEGEFEYGSVYKAYLLNAGENIKQEKSINTN